MSGQDVDYNTPEMRTMDEMANGLNEFSGNLMGLLQILTSQLSNLQKSHDSLAHTVQNLESNLQATTRELAHLKSETNDQRKKIDEVTNAVILVNPTGTAINVNQLGGNGGGASGLISSSNGNEGSLSLMSPARSVASGRKGSYADNKIGSPRIPKENTLKFQLGKALNDAVQKFSTNCSRLASPPMSRTHSQLGDGMDDSIPIEEKLQKFETALLVQENINKINAAIVKSSNEASQFEMENLQGQLKKLELDINAQKLENDGLKASISDLYGKLMSMANSRVPTPTSKIFSQPGSTRSMMMSPKGGGQGQGQGQGGGFLSNQINGISENSISSPTAMSFGSSYDNNSNNIVNVRGGQGHISPFFNSMSNNDNIHYDNYSNPPTVAMVVMDEQTKQKFDTTVDKTDQLDKTTKKLSNAVDSIMAQVEELRDRMNQMKSDIQLPVDPNDMESPRSLYEVNNSSDSDISNDQDHNLDHNSVSNPNTKHSVHHNHSHNHNRSYNYNRGHGHSNSHGVASSSSKASFKKRVLRLRDQWQHVYNDVKYGLLRHAVESGHTSNFPNILEATTIEEREKSVLHKAEDFINLINESLLELENLESSDDPSASVFPKLDKITLAAEDLLLMNDSQMGFDEDKDEKLENLYCEDGTKAIKNKIDDATKLSTKILEEIDDKIFLKRRLDKMDKLITRKAEYSSMKHTESELKRLISNKLEKQDMIEALQKKASLSDINKLKDLLHRNLQNVVDGNGGNQIVDFSDNMGSNNQEEEEISYAADGSIISKPFHRFIPSTAMVSTFKEMVTKDISDLSNRFDLLHRHFQDLQEYCDTFVPRNEVEEAMHALFQEVRTMKSQGVTQTMFKDGLRLKADASELERLVSSLTAAVGELNGLGDASALHARCLVCDKPVSSLSKWRHPNQIGYDKSSDETPENETLRPQTSSTKALSSGFERLGGTNTTNTGSPSRPDRNILSNKEKIKVSTDVSILRNSIDLPPIQDNSLSIKYHRDHRIRTSVGGGMSSWTMDKR